ncbi:16S rRNA (cytidine(1402)-2'-O)-methyltransferase [Chitinophaga sancti]|uniref:Ribosomal RNA small subunit methyltransferase I n=1 Tax=Chitinophaga sancti TaxID=1004 RepID=A0A1K1RF30_9BACT|nr:16S rRNA (cytidine(1402)-2'-O)-methyltransferase [Chitinophaga sancti]WQD65706.1 16S rRNA (cytidine(1402)-2'-O)-methyltransferase [Chitinophaga sancti]WQG88672.1 16S rRNA (cytidine(1402)-2'-O)-methyltransferase [Chitinophaga sancti]SFW70476.1 16S rRNA (cytidine1402-2'-O)-methyltransferase [Chitinophaga sancti]
MKLYLVPSPIGNLADITYRAVKVLEEADLVLAEDTRTSGVLLKHYNINKPITPYHQHNEHKVLQHLLQQLQGGKTMALITDAGTPGVSDPGFLLVRECVRAGVPVECLPGATAFVPALVNSGIPMTRFSFEGFLPLKKGRHTLFTQLSTDERTLVFYESPHRLVKTLEDMIGYFGADRPCCVSRELTKMFEENKRGTLQEVHDYYKEKGVKGEIVLILQGAAGKKKSQEEEE